MSESIRWGLLGLGSITRRFATGLRSLPDTEISAVGSRSQAKADAFGAAFGVRNCHGSYEALAQDPEVDVVYIGTPHSAHMPNTLLCLEAGKHVLCEKPLAVNAREAAAMIDCARANQRFLMEAFWTRFLPGMVKLRELLARRVIGDIMLVQADFGYRVGRVEPKSRIFAPQLAGGALLDVGSYCVQLASMVYGQQPRDIASHVSIGSSGVDELSVSIFRYSRGQMASMATAIRLNTPHEARILGTQGSIAIPDWWQLDEMTVTVAGQRAETLRFETVGNGFQYEAAAVGDCIRRGQLECDSMPLDESYSNMQTMDRLRAIWGLRYPSDG